MTKSIEELLDEATQSANNENISGDILVDMTPNHIISTEETVNPDTLDTQQAEGYSSDAVLELLKKSLNIHWQQTTVLSAQAVHLDRWGYKKLAAIIKADALEEHEHAMINLSRLEFFDADYQPLVVQPPSWTRHDMMAIINYNLASVREASSIEKQTITAARAVGDELTANIMIPLLQGSENGIKLYEGYIKLISQMGIDNFLTLQV
jgi:bacterioferritin (cytochrome b1)